MKALSLKQPWATLMQMGDKRVETRRQRMRAAIGWLAIHASQTWTPDQVAVVLREPFRSVLKNYNLQPDDLPRGAVVALVRVTRIVPTEEIAPTLAATRPQEIAFGDYRSGRFAYVTDDLRPLVRPVYCRGSLGVFQLGAGDSERVRLELDGHGILPDDLVVH